MVKIKTVRVRMMSVLQCRQYGWSVGKGPIVELTLEDLIILLIEEAMLSDSKFEIFLLEPICCVQLD